MAITRNPEYRGQDYPYDSELVPPHLNEGISIIKKPLAADAATNIAIGAICYISAGTEANDATATTAEYGKTDQQDGGLWLAYKPSGLAALSFAHTTTSGAYPWLAPNTSITASDYQLAAEDEFIGILIKIGMKFWARIGSDITADVVHNYTYYCGTTGFPAAEGDPDGETIAEKGHAFRAVASFTNMNWALFEYKGLVAYDDTA